MTSRKTEVIHELKPATTGSALSAATDLIRFEKNLLQMGFFGAHDTRHNSQSSRRIEQVVNREGQKIKVSAEFRASQELGLPSTSDRDKYIAFMRIAMEEKNRRGELANPIRFTGYRMLKQLGHSYSGENYEDINRWGQRMADTTITSEQVIYLAARKRYANKTVHVFRSFTRAGQSNIDDTGRTECYEVVLEDWLLENLNQSYVVPEDFNAYRKLKRPTAKGIFGYLHLWFHASHGRQIEKDYSELCVLLNIPAYRHVSKIKDTMGRSLDELIDVGYLLTWDVKPMSTKDGYKLVLLPGQQLLDVLAISQRKQLGKRADDAQILAEPQKLVVKALTDHGVSLGKATALASQFNPRTVMDHIEYVEFLLSQDKRKTFDNPAGFLIYSVENQSPIPSGFTTSSRRREQEEYSRTQTQKAAKASALRLDYQEWQALKIEHEISSSLDDVELEMKLREIVSLRVKTDGRFRLMTSPQQKAVALQLLRQDTLEKLALPSFDEWLLQNAQPNLF